MSEERTDKVARIILFCLLMLLLAIMPQVLSAPFLGTEGYGSVRSLLSWMTFPLKFLIVLQFVRHEGGDSIAELGLETDKNTWPHLIVGGAAGSAAAALIFLIVLAFGGQVASP